jgi:predicted Ser/Thr protein kinase
MFSIKVKRQDIRFTKQISVTRISNLSKYIISNTDLSTLIDFFRTITDEPNNFTSAGVIVLGITSISDHNLI